MLVLSTALTRVSQATVTPWRSSSAWTSAPSFRVDRRQDLRELLELRDREPPGGEPLGHLKADVAGADDHRLGDPGPLECLGEREGVIHRVQQVDAVVGSEPV